MRQLKKIIFSFIRLFHNQRDTKKKFSVKEQKRQLIQLTRQLCVDEQAHETKKLFLIDGPDLLFQTQIFI